MHRSRPNSPSVEASKISRKRRNAVARSTQPPTRKAQPEAPEASKSEQLLEEIQAINSAFDALEDPEPVVNVHKLTEYATQFIVRPWVNREDYWSVYWDLMREAKLRLDREQLPLGIPRHDVQLHGEPTG
jgi:small-conductance mechanosensitive channel